MTCNDDKATKGSERTKHSLLWWWPDLQVESLAGPACNPVCQTSWKSTRRASCIIAFGSPSEIKGWSQKKKEKKERTCSQERVLIATSWKAY